jgi:hypothetical protein
MEFFLFDDVLVQHFLFENTFCKKGKIIVVFFPFKATQVLRWDRVIWLSVTAAWIANKDPAT